MNKPTKIATAVLAVFMATCAYLAYTQPAWMIQYQQRYAPNLVHRVQSPPPIAPAEIEQQKMMLQAIAAEVSKKLDLQLRAIREEQVQKNKTLLINNQQDQQTISHKQMRKMYNVHE